ncbi:MAG TPA: hypothetical protein DIU15_11950, partial [Deltaproteobacteria bacterium]|nr:hypothetical protein [Deltaproteobacteria bacterium]
MSLAAVTAEPFDSEAVLSRTLFADITRLRVAEPDLVMELSARRQRAAPLGPDGKLCILAADHVARGVTSSGPDPLAMLDRRDLLARLVHVLRCGAADGVLATVDVLEELLLLDHLVQERGDASFLGGRRLIASLNRGGLAGAAWELNDPPTGASPRTCARLSLDGAKLLLRVALEDRDSLETLRHADALITAMNEYRLPVFVEPLPVRRVADGGFELVREAEPLARLVGVASALGDSSRYLWLKLPWCEDFQMVAGATTLPIVLLGGPSAGEPRQLLEQV